MPWKPRQRAEWERANDELRMVIIQLRHEMENKQRAVSRFKVRVRERSSKIDQLTGTIDRLREQNKRLDQEAEWLCAMVVGSGPLP